MDVWFCLSAGTTAERPLMRNGSILIRSMRALRSAPGHLCFSLDFDLHRCGPTGHNPIWGHFRTVGENEAAGAAEAVFFVVGAQFGGWFNY